MSESDARRVSLAPRPPCQPVRKPISEDSLLYVRSIVSTIVNVEGSGINQTVLPPIYTLLMGSETSDYIRDPAAIWILLELLPHFNHALQMEVWQRLISIIGRSLRNLQLCCSLALIPHCLELLPDCDGAIASRIAELVGTLTAYDLSVDELKLLLNNLTAKDGAWPIHSVKLLTAMRMLPRRSIPEIMFNFSGELGSAITVPPLARWPTNPGFTINMWISLDPRFMVPNHKPFLYWLKTGRGLGYSALISGQYLILETVTGKGQLTGKMSRTPSKVEKVLEPHKWYMITVVYIYHRLKNCELLCYINGRLAHKQDIGFVQTSEPFDKCYIGSSPRATVETSFCGQMSSVTLFADTLSTAAVQAIHRLGSDYKHAYQHSNEHDEPIPSADHALLYSGRLAGNIVFSYNPKACNGQLCFEIGQNNMLGYFVNSSHAILLDGVETIATRNAQSALHSLGGIQVLLPLFEQLSSCPDSTPELCATLLWLFVDLVKGSATCQAYIATHRTLLVIGHLLGKCKPHFLSDSALEALLSLGRTLVDIKHVPLLNSLINDILLMTEMWVRTPVEVQVKLYSVLSTEFIGGVSAESCDLRQSLSIVRIIVILTDYYWIEREEAVHGLDRTLTKDDVISIRAFLLLTSKQSIMKSKSPPPEEISCLLSYLVYTNSPSHLIDVLQLLLALMCEHSNALLSKFEELGGVKVLFILFRHYDESVRLYGLKILGAYLHATPAKSCVKLLTKHSLFSIIAERLAASSDIVTIATYNVLWELMTDHISRQLIFDRHPDADPDAKIVYPHMLQVIAVLVLKTPTLDDSPEHHLIVKENNLKICKHFLTYLLLILQRNKENRRNAISLTGWQRWLIGLMMEWADSGSEGSHVTDLAYSLFQTLLHHALQWEQEGWLVWVETLAVLHANLTQGKGTDPNAEVPPVVEDCNADDEASMTSSSVPVPEIHIERETPLPKPALDDETKCSESSSSITASTITVTRIEECDLSEIDVQENDIQDEDVKEEVDDEVVEELTSDETVVSDRNDVQYTGEDELKKEDIGGIDEDVALENWLSAEHGEKASSSVEDDGNGEEEEEEGEEKVEMLGNEDILEKDKVKKHDSDSGLEEEEFPSDHSETKDAESELIEKVDGLTLDDAETTDEVNAESAEVKETIKDPTKLTKIDDVTTIKKVKKLNDAEAVKEVEIDIVIENGTDDVEEEEVVVNNIGIPCTPVTDTLSLSQEYDDGASVEAIAGSIPADISSEDEKTQSVVSDSPIRGTSPISDPPVRGTSPAGSFEVTPEMPCDSSDEGTASTSSLPQRNTTPSSCQKNSSWPWPGYPFNPSQWRFKSIPSFDWSAAHQRLLKDLLIALSTTMKLWRSGQRSMSEIVNARDNGVYMTNIAHLISLTADNLVVECGGVGKLVNEITVPGKHSAPDSYIPVMEFDGAYQLVDLLVGIVDTVVFCSVLNFSPVEAARSLKQGGMMRIALRLVCCHTTINCLKKRTQQRLRVSNPIVWELLQAEVESKLLPLGVVGDPLRRHLEQRLEDRHAESLKADCLLEEKDIYCLRSCVMRDLDLYMKESEQQALQVLFYLSVLTVTQYHEIVNRHPGVGDSVSDQVKRSLNHVGPLLNELLLDFQGYFSKTILGTHGRELMNEGMACLKGDVSVVELAMQLCSQEWLTALEKHAGLSFTKLLREGRHIATSTDEYLIKLASWSENVASESIAEHIVKLADFEATTKTMLTALLAEQQTSRRTIHSVQRQSVYTGEKEWSHVHQYSVQMQRENYDAQFFKLDLWEDSSRRRYKFLFNPEGSRHEEATITMPKKSPQSNENPIPSVLIAQHLAQCQTKSITPPDTEEEADNLLDEADHEHNKDNLLFSESGRLLLPGREISGTLTITRRATIFSSDEDASEENNFKFYNVDVSAVFTRRYLHVYRAVEVFTIGHKSWLFVLSDYVAVRRAVAALPRVGVGLQYGLPTRRQISLAHPKRLLRESYMMDKWRAREISNFDYLMFLNTIAGRSYNDLGQYPVFPWVITNYTSDTLDLSDPGNYRDLSKPMGCQSPEREAKFREKFEHSKDGAAPPFHYGTHYSTPGFVLMWLLRIEPFTSLFLKLQGGKFDMPCRIFASMAQAWENSQRDASDVKELIPEMYYLPELFLNASQYDLGMDDEGNVVDHVRLPPWAKDAHHFVKVHSDALESEYVSSNLHKWIDIIFGVSQRGEPADSACNSFYYTSYEGLCDPSQVDDKMIQAALEEQIRSFGQTPPQLLTTRHPARNSLQHLLNSNIKSLNSISASLTITKDVPVTSVKPLMMPQLHSVPYLLSISGNQVFSTSKFVPSIQSPYQVFIEADPAPRTIPESVDPALSTAPSSYGISPDGRTIFSCGFWDSSFKSFAVDTGKQIQAMFGHRDLVTCLSISDSRPTIHVPPTRLADAIIVTGSRDATVCVWDWSGRVQRVMGVDGKNASPRSVLTGHTDEIQCVFVCSDQGCVLSASRNSPLLLHRVTGQLIRKIMAPQNCTSPVSILLTSQAHIVAHYTDGPGKLAVFSPNGNILTCQELQEQVLAMVVDQNGEYLVTGGFNLTPVVRSLSTLSPVLRLAPCSSSIRSLAISHDKRYLIAGLTNGTINIYPIDFRRITTQADNR